MRVIKSQQCGSGQRYVPAEHKLANAPPSCAAGLSPKRLFAATEFSNGMAGSRVMVVMTNEEKLLGGCGMRVDAPTAHMFPQSCDRIRARKGPQSVPWGAGGSAATVLFERDRHARREGEDEASASVLVGTAERRDVAGNLKVAGDPGFVRP
jgi:hypothetical protein